MRECFIVLYVSVSQDRIDSKISFEEYSSIIDPLCTIMTREERTEASNRVIAIK